MTQYRKRPVVVEAEPVRQLVYDATHNWVGLPGWVAGAYERGEIIFTPNGLRVLTLEGPMIAQLDDMLIRGTEGEIYPCKPAAFASTFEAV